MPHPSPIVRNQMSVAALILVVITAAALPAAEPEPTSKAGDVAVKAAAAEDCAKLDDPKTRGLMDGRLMHLLLACGRADELGMVRSEPATSSTTEAGNDVPVNNPATDTPDTASHTQSETSIAVSGTTGTVCSGYNDSWEGIVSNNGFSGFSRSTDGGQTFVDRGGLGAGNWGDPSLVWRTADESFYFATLGDTGLRLYRSADDCQTFQLVGNITSGGSDDKELMAVDNNPASPSYGRLYVVWTNFSVDSKIWAIRSEDAGATWAGAQAISSSSNVQGAWPVVAPDGTVYAGWVEFGSGTVSIRVSKSTNGGVSWTAVASPAAGKGQPQDSAASGTCFRAALRGNIRYLPSPQLAVGPDGVLHAIYSYDPDTAGSGDTVDVFYRRSTDGGATWQAEVRVNDDATTTDQFFPTLAVSDSNIVSAAWYDRRNDPNNLLIDYYQSFSYDGGLTWEPNVRLSDVSTPVYLDPELASCYHGDYDTQVMSDTHALVQWSDDRNLQGGHNDPDVYLDTQAISTDYLLLADPGQQSICVPADAVYALDLPQFQSFGEPVTLSVDGVPAGATASFASNPVLPPGTSQLTIGNTGVLSPGSSTMTVTGTSNPSSLVHDDQITLHIFTLAPSSPTLVAPVDGALGQALRPTFSWSAATQGATSHLEVATDAAFSNVVVDAPGLTETSYTPSSDLDSNTQHFWRVRAVNPCGESPVAAVFDFYTQALAGDCGFGTAPEIGFEEDFEAGAVGWTHDGTGDTWALQSANVHGGAAAFHANDTDAVSDQRLVSPPMALPASGTPLTLQFWSRQEIESSGSSACYDGGIVEISTDDGASWTQLAGTLMVTDPYDGPVSSSFSNPLAGLDAWCGNPQDWTRAVVDLAAYGGQTVRFRFRLGTDTSVGYPGWTVDDLKIQSCRPDLPEIFSDGFESGGTTAWSSSVP